jgi:5,10-methylenetetrahydrofolate reductase
MVEGARAAAGRAPFAGRPPFEVGVAAGLRSLPAWKRDADFVFVQVGFSLDRLLAWRSANEVAGDVYAGVIVVASPVMARSLAATVPDIEVPPALVAALADDPDAGVAAALDLVAGIEASGAFAGVHLVPVGRYRQVAAHLERRRRTRGEAPT